MSPGRKAALGGETLSTRQLNRALLARQMLLARERVAPVAAVERLAGMQAQVPRPPFAGLWTRLAKFQREDLLGLAHEKKVVRATAMRGTIHLLSAADFLTLRPALADALIAGAMSIVRKQVQGMSLENVYQTGRRFFGDAPATFDDLRKHLEQKHPKDVVRGMAYLVRMGVPLAMMPDDVPWGWPASARFVLAEQWLGRKIPLKAPPLEDLVLRYLAAFGPATPGDAQAWSGLKGLRETFERLRPRLATFRDERKRELFDLPDAPRPQADVAAPVRFLPEFDNALLAHEDRSRILADAHRPLVISKNLLVAGTVLVDGFVAGTWRLDAKKTAATLEVRPFGSIPKGARGGLEEEGEGLLRFLAPEASRHTFTIAR